MTKDRLELYDPVTKLACSYGKVPGAGWRSGLDVFDTTTGESVFTIDVERLSALDPTVRSLVGGFLYMSTDDQDLKIDVSTGDVVNKTATVYPIGVIGDYFYLSDGTLERQS